MEQIFEAWWKLFEQSPKWNQIVLQTWLYGFFCYVHDCQDADTWVPIPFEEFYDYANEFREIPTGAVTSVMLPLIRIIRKTPLISKQEFDMQYAKFMKKVDEALPEEIDILEELFTGEDLSEEVRERVWNNLAFILPELPKPITRPHTRRVNGRRAITPIKRRHGRRALTVKNIAHK